MGLKNLYRTSENKYYGLGEIRKYLLISLLVMFLIFSGISFVSQIAATRENNESPEIAYLAIETTIDNNYATTEIYVMFRNPNNYSVDETFSFQIPEKAFISNFSLTINNETHYAQIVPKDVGQQKYQDAAINGSDAGLVEAKGKNIFSYSVSLSPYQELVVGLRYEQFLEKSLGGYRYIIPLTEGSANRNIDSFSVDITVRSQLYVTALDLETYRDEANIDWASVNQVDVSYQTSSSSIKDDFIITYELTVPPINGTLLNYNNGSDEFFFHIFSPQRTDLGGQAMAKEIIFVLDKSGSMSGTKISQLKTAFNEIVDQLPGQDTFNIIMFDSSIKKYKSELIGASEDNKTEAVNYINNIQAGGSTNINDALTTALEMFEITETTVPIIVMLTDGLPTAGVTNTEAIRENIKDKNTAGVAIFSLGFGFDVDFEFLKAMSLENYGIAIRIYEGEDASEQITDFYKTISTPLLKGLTFTYSNGTHEIYPTTVDQLFEGSEIVVVGKYNGELREITATVEATSWEGMRTFQETFDLKNNTDHSFIPRFWAYAKIMFLLDTLAVSGNNESIVENATALALAYGFVTPYTSLLVEIQEPEPEPEQEPEPEEPDEDLSDEWELKHAPLTTGSEGESESESESVSESESESEDSDGDIIPDSDEPAHRTDQGEPTPPSSKLDQDDDNDGYPDPGSYPAPLPEMTVNDEDEKSQAAEEALNSMGMSVLPLIIFVIIILLSLFFYTKIKRHRLLENRRREMIFNYVNKYPGEHFRGIQKALHLEVGVVAHHINKLEREDFIKSRQDGQKRRFYPMDAKIDVKLILSKLQERILSGIKKNPGISRTLLAEKIGENKKVVGYHITLLQRAGFILVEKHGRESLCYSAVGV